jgi:hypothetical protein
LVTSNISGCHGEINWFAIDKKPMHWVSQELSPIQPLVGDVVSVNGFQRRPKRFTPH